MCVCVCGGGGGGGGGRGRPHTLASEYQLLPSAQDKLLKYVG